MKTSELTRSEQALELREKNVSYEAIAETLKVKVHTARGMVSVARKKRLALAQKSQPPVAKPEVAPEPATMQVTDLTCIP